MALLGVGRSDILSEQFWGGGGSTLYISIPAHLSAHGWFFCKTSQSGPFYTFGMHIFVELTSARCLYALCSMNMILVSEASFQKERKSE